MDIARRVLPKQRAKILLVEDEPSVRRSLQLLLQSNGYEVRAFASSSALLADPTASDAACLVADYLLTDCNGIDTLRQLRSRGWGGPAVLITGFPSTALADSARNAGFAAVFEKPLRRHALVKAVERLVQPGDGG